MTTTGYLRVPAREAADTMYEDPGQVMFGDGYEVVLHGTPDELRKFADKILRCADRQEALAQVHEIADRTNVVVLDRALGATQ